MAKQITQTERKRLEADRAVYAEKFQKAKESFLVNKAEGDISENAGYDAAVADMEMYGQELARIDAKLKSAEVIDSWMFKLRLVEPDKHETVFDIELSTNDTISFDFDAPGPWQGAVTKYSKLGAQLDRLSSNARTPEDLVGQKFSYIDNKQNKQSFTILEARIG